VSVHIYIHVCVSGIHFTFVSTSFIDKYILFLRIMWYFFYHIIVRRKRC